MNKTISKRVFAFIADAARLCPGVEFHPHENFCKDGKVYVNVVNGSKNRVFLVHNIYPDWQTPQDVRDWVDKLPTRKRSKHA